MIRLTAVLLVLLASPVSAFNEPEGFRGVKFGAIYADVREIIEKDKGYCMGTAIRTCGGKGTVGPVDVRLGWLFSDPEDTFMVGFITFDPGQWPLLSGFFLERYGKPTERRQETLTNAMGVKVVIEHLRWIGKRTVVELRRYSTKLTEGRAIISTRDWWDKIARETEKTIQKGKDDL